MTQKVILADSSERTHLTMHARRMVIATDQTEMLKNKRRAVLIQKAGRKRASCLFLIDQVIKRIGERDSSPPPEMP